MKRVLTNLCCICLFQIAFGQTTRQTILFNDGWKFYKGDTTGADNAGFNDSKWRKVTLPHDWSIEGPFNASWASSTAFLPTGIGWYRKTFQLQPGIANKSLKLYFDGVNKNSEVWINGYELGKRPNGFVSFFYDISPYVNKSGLNTIAVRVDHSEYADSRWYTGSGIYRNVYLIATSPVHVDIWGLAFESGNVTSASADAKATVSVFNETAAGSTVNVKAELLDYNGNIASTGVQTLALGAGRHQSCSIPLSIQNPRLWSVDHPERYRLKVSLESGGVPVDVLFSSVGIRSAVFDKDKGFTLNGQSLKLKGVCIHDDAGCFGVAVPEVIWERRLRILKEEGVNALRLSHNPHADYIYDLCDKLGLLVMDEAFDEWEIGKNKWIAGWNVGKPGNDGYHEYFKEWADRDLADMIQRDRLHPSIIFWSIGNEIDYPNDPYTHPILNTGNNPQIYGKGYTPGHPAASEMTPIASHLVSVVKKFDTSRPVTAALAGVVMSNEAGYPDVLDVVGYNYQEFRYGADHQKYPNRIIYGSENGMNADAWDAVVKNDFIAGQFLWTGIDYLGEANKWPERSSTPGLIDLAGFTKPEFYFRQSLWSDKPMVYIGVNAIPTGHQKEKHNAEPNWNFSAGDKLRVSCYTNCTEAELFLNGKSLGKQTLAQSPNKILFWDVDYQPGELIVKAYSNGTLVKQDRLVTTGEPVKLATGAYATLNDNSIQQITISIVDKIGNIVYNANNEVTVKVSGNATLLGLESGDASSHEDYRSNKRRAFRGKLIAYIKYEPVPGDTIRGNVSVSAEGLTGLSL